MKRYYTCCLFLVMGLACALANVRGSLKPRILVSTDIGGTDADDNQSMIHLLMYANEFDIEGLVSSPSYGNGTKEEICRMIDLYAQDRPQLMRLGDGFPTADALKAVTKQGRHGIVPPAGYSQPTEGSEWIVRCARRADARPLWVLVWGGLEDVAQALHDAPDIAPRIRVYWIGGPNKKWGANSYNYIAQNFPDLWFIENNASYRGFIGSFTDQGYYQVPFWKNAMQGRCVMGNDFRHYYKGILKMGDTPSLLYLMGNDEMNIARRGGLTFDPDDPCSPHWGGQFEPMNASPKFVITGPLTVADTIPCYSLIEWRLRGPVREDLAVDSVCFTMRTDNQNWQGYYAGDGLYIVRYAPKAPATLRYSITSPIEGFPCHEGVFAIGQLWPDTDHYVYDNDHLKSEPIKLGATWFTDCSDTTLQGGSSDYEDYQKLNNQWQGAATIAVWRNDILLDWQRRLSGIFP